MQGNRKCSRFSIISLAIAVGVANGLCMMLLALAGMYWNYGVVMIQELSLLYKGFAATGVGSAYGFGWGFIDGFFFGLVIAAIYNLCLYFCPSRDR